MSGDGRTAASTTTPLPTYLRLADFIRGDSPSILMFFSQSQFSMFTKEAEGSKDECEEKKL